MTLASPVTENAMPLRVARSAGAYQLLDIQGHDRLHGAHPELGHHQHKKQRQQDRRARNRNEAAKDRSAAARLRRRYKALIHGEPDEGQRQQDRRRGAVERNAVAAGQIGQCAADQWTHQRADELAGAEPAERVAEPPLRDLARHQRDCRTGKSGEYAHQRAKRKKLPDIRRHAHQCGEHADGEARAQQHQLAAAAVGDASPHR
jgi:hypothetical protein